MSGWETVWENELGGFDNSRRRRKGIGEVDENVALMNAKVTPLFKNAQVSPLKLHIH